MRNPLQQGLKLLLFGASSDFTLTAIAHPLGWFETFCQTSVLGRAIVIRMSMLLLWHVLYHRLLRQFFPSVFPSYQVKKVYHCTDIFNFHKKISMLMQTTAKVAFYLLALRLPTGLRLNVGGYKLEVNSHK